jgi:flagellar motor switch protein FliG
MNLNNNNMYQTNQQAWDEVMETEFETSATKICREMFGQDNLIGLTNDQRDLFWKSI